MGVDKTILKSEYNLFAIPNTPPARASGAGHGHAYGRFSSDKPVGQASTLPKKYHLSDVPKFVMEGNFKKPYSVPEMKRCLLRLNHPHQGCYG